jgi:hypothetical protein
MEMEIITLFVGQFLLIYVLGIQSLMVRDDNYVGAAIGATLIGISQFYLTSLISNMGIESIGTLAWCVFVVAGPLAIVTSMKTHPFIARLTKKKNKKIN